MPLGVCIRLRNLISSLINLQQFFCGMQLTDELGTTKKANGVLDKLNICSYKQAQGREAKERQLVCSRPMNLLGQKLSVALPTEQ